MAADGPPMRLSAGEVFAGKLRLEREFAAGGMGSLWRAWNTQLGIPVAVKVMAAGMAGSPGFVARFEREAKAAAQIRSPHVVQVYEHGVHERHPYIVMELLEGEDLQQRLKREKRLPLLPAVHILRDICKALHRAHELGIVHRDLKPANIFLARDGGDEIVKVLDFGIAKLMHDDGINLTATGEMIGTTHYMSPEHIQGARHVDHRADLWALAAIAFRTLVGKLPFAGQPLEIMRQILSGPVPVPSSIAPDLSPDVDAFFARAMARDIDQRFQSARDLADALSRLVGRESLSDVSSRPVPFVKAEDVSTLAVARLNATHPMPSPGVGAGAAGGPGMGTMLMNHPTAPAAAPPPQLEQTMPLDATRPALPDAARAALAALPGPSPLLRARPGETMAQPPAPMAQPPAARPSWVVWAVIAALVLAAVVVVAAITVAKGQEPERMPIPLPSAR